MAAQTEAAKAQSNKQGYYLFALIVGMVGLTYASVPLYRMFCQVLASTHTPCLSCTHASTGRLGQTLRTCATGQATGYGGTVKRVKSVEEKIATSKTLDDAARATVQEREVRPRSR